MYRNVICSVIRQGAWVNRGWISVAVMGHVGSDQVERSRSLCLNGSRLCTPMVEHRSHTAETTCTVMGWVYNTSWRSGGQWVELVLFRSSHSWSMRMHMAGTKPCPNTFSPCFHVIGHNGEDGTGQMVKTETAEGGRDKVHSDHCNFTRLSQRRISHVPMVVPSSMEPLGKGIPSDQDQVYPMEMEIDKWPRIDF